MVTWFSQVLLFHTNTVRAGSEGPELAEPDDNQPHHKLTDTQASWMRARRNRTWTAFLHGYLRGGGRVNQHQFSSARRLKRNFPSAFGIHTHRPSARFCGFPEKNLSELSTVSGCREPERAIHVFWIPQRLTSSSSFLFFFWRVSSTLFVVRRYVALCSQHHALQAISNSRLCHSKDSNEQLSHMMATIPKKSA